MAPKVDNRKDQQANMQTIALPDFLVQADAQSVPTSGQSGQMTPSCDQMTPSCDGQLFKNNRKLAEFLNGWPTTQHISYAVKLEQNNIALKAQASGIDKRLLEVVDRTKDIKDQAELADLFVIIDSLKAIEDNFKGTLFGERAS